MKKTGCLLECQSEEQEVWHVRVDFNKVTDEKKLRVVCEAGMLRWHAAVSCQGTTHTGSKQSCVNCVKIFYRINRGHINRID